MSASRPPPQAGSRPDGTRRSPGGVPRAAVAVLAAWVLCALIYLPAARYGFFHADDDIYVRDNPNVGAGLSWRAVAWSLRPQGYAGNWHPLTWVSLMADVELFGPGPRAHHAVNVLLHAVNAALLFALLARLTGALWRSAAAALLFAVHPLHVEAVVWISERKEVLATTFLLLAALAWLRYCRRPGAGRYLAAAATYALGLMAKPTLVTFPAALLLLDCWPLGRCRRLGSQGGRAWGRLIAEKLPLAALACVSAALTVRAQASANLVTSADAIPPLWRVANAVKAAAWYLGKTVWPSGLAVHYPHLGSLLPPWQPLLAAAVLALLGGAAFRLRKREPALLFGWLWHLGTLVPVSGLVQVGSQAMADRYTYVPHVGVFVALAWGTASLARRRPGGAPLAVAALAAAVLGLAAVARVQVGYWRDDLTMYRRTLAVTEGNWLIENHMGQILSRQARYAEAEAHLSRAIALRPPFWDVSRGSGMRAHLDLGDNYLNQNRLREAEARYRSVIARVPELAEAHLRLGVALERQGRVGEAVASYRQAVARDPQLAEAPFRLAMALEGQGALAEALPWYRRAAQLAPASESIRRRLERAEARARAAGTPAGGR